MESVHLHLLINHVPILATIYSMLVFIWGMIKSEKKYYQLAMAGFVIAGLFSLVALQSGEGAEEAVEHLAGVSESMIHEHEEAAEITNWIAALVGLVSIGGILYYKNKPAIKKAFVMTLLVLGFFSSGAFTYTAYLGGQIRHTEIRSQDSGASATSAENEDGDHQEDEDDDD